MSDLAAARAAAEAIRAKHHQSIAHDVEVPVEGGRATVLEDVEYCAGCGDLSGYCPDAEHAETILAYLEKIPAIRTLVRPQSGQPARGLIGSNDTDHDDPEWAAPLDGGGQS